MKFYLTVEKDDEVLLEITAPTFEILSEKIGAWERTQGNVIAGVDFTESLEDLETI